MNFNSVMLAAGLCGLWPALAGCSEGEGTLESPGRSAPSGSVGGAGGAAADVDDYLPVELADGLAPTPPMGWNSWNRFHCNVSAGRIQDIADAMVESGMQEVGYEYVNIDDCWAAQERAEDGSIQFDDAFPDGIQPLADYVHERGLKLGVYSDRGTATCAGRLGSNGYEEQDANSYAEWGVDYLKYDNCNAAEETIVEDYERMGQALIDTGRPIVYSLCAWAFHEWGIGLGHLWRTTGDIEDAWESVVGIAANNQRLAGYAGPNGWNDPDMLEVGNGQMTAREYRAHFSLWSIMAAPLIAGNDLTRMTEETREILTNREIIAMNQDALGLQGSPVRTEGELSIWAKPLNESGARAVILFNAGEANAEITARFDEIGLGPGEALVRDLWQGEDLGSFEDSFTTTVLPHGVAALKIVGKEPPPPSGRVQLSELTWTYAANGLGPVERDQNVGASQPGDGDPIALGGTSHDTGLGVAGPSLVIFRLGQACTRFTAEVGVDDVAESRGSVVFRVIADGELLFESDVLTGDSPSESVDVDVTDKHRLRLLVTNGGDGSAWDRASWADAELDCAP